MSTQLAQIELTQPDTIQVSALRGTEIDNLDPDLLEAERPASVGRGIVYAMMIATPFWVLFAFVVYLLI
jgi:hypothetical protein